MGTKRMDIIRKGRVKERVNDSFPFCQATLELYSRSAGKGKGKREREGKERKLPKREGEKE